MLHFGAYLCLGLFLSIGLLFPDPRNHYRSYDQPSETGFNILACVIVSLIWPAVLVVMMLYFLRYLSGPKLPKIPDSGIRRPK